jgi:hypothetical protein
VVREVVIRSWCDVCAQDPDAEHREGMTVWITLGVVALEIDLCEEHEDELWTPMREALDKLGRPATPLAGPLPTPAPRVTGRPRVLSAGWPCLLCGKELTSSGLSMHVSKTHGGPSALPWGETCPLCLEGGLTRTSLGQHTQRAHGLAGGAGSLFRVALEEGRNLEVVDAVRMLWQEARSAGVAPGPASEQGSEQGLGAAGVAARVPNPPKGPGRGRRPAAAAS